MHTSAQVLCLLTILWIIDEQGVRLCERGNSRNADLFPEGRVNWLRR